jgi:stage II sporulation protein M
MTVFERAIRPHLRVLTVLFAAGCAVGFLAPAPAREAVLTQLRALFLPYRQLPSGALFLFILRHNVTASLATLLAGVFYGLVPIVSIAGNGVALGMVCRQALRSQGPATLLAKIVPHGVFELPALILAASYGLWLGLPALGGAEGSGNQRLGERVRVALRGYAMIVLPLLVVAAAIEAFLISRLR